MHLILGNHEAMVLTGDRARHPSHRDLAKPDLDASLARFGVSRLFVGHTIVPTVTALYDGSRSR